MAKCLLRQISAEACLTRQHFIFGFSGLSWTHNFASLPLLFPGTGIHLPFTFLHKDIDEEVVTIVGLSQPYGALVVLDAIIDVLPREAWEAGVNPQTLDLPEKLDSHFIADLVTEIHVSRYARWREELLDGARGPDDLLPYCPESQRSRFLDQKASFIVSFLTTSPPPVRTYEVKIVPMVSPQHPAIPFSAVLPYPTASQVQIRFEIDTKPWNDVVDPLTGATLSFVPPLQLKTSVNFWNLLPMEFQDGIWTLTINLLRSYNPAMFSFQDSSPLPFIYESRLAELVKESLLKVRSNGLRSVLVIVPDDHKLLRLTAQHYYESLGLQNSTPRFLER